MNDYPVPETSAIYYYYDVNDVERNQEARISRAPQVRPSPMMRAPGDGGRKNDTSSNPSRNASSKGKEPAEENSQNRNSQESFHNSFLMYAAAHETPAKLQALLEDSRVNINDRDNYKNTALMHAIRAGSLDNVLV